MESWRVVFRKGLAPLFSDEGLDALRMALADDDPRLLQGGTTQPPPLQCMRTVEYRLVPRFPAYMVGTDGSLWSKHIRGAKGKRLSSKWNAAAGQTEKNGYIRDSLHRPGEFRRVRRHQVVLETFVGPCPAHMEACHENDVKSDNRLCNLTWGTRAKNVCDAHRNDRMSTGEKKPNAKLSMATAEAIRKERTEGKDSLKTLAQRYCVHIGTIRQVLSHRTFKPRDIPNGILVEAADAIGFAAWKGDGLETVGEVEEYFARSCFDADKLLGEPAGVRWFLNAYDNWPRDVMLSELGAEVAREQQRRALIANAPGRRTDAHP